MSSPLQSGSLVSTGALPSRFLPDRPLETVGGAGIARPAALAQIIDDPRTYLGRTILTQLELHATLSDVEPDGRDVRNRAPVQRLVRGEGPEAALRLVAGEEAHLLRRQERGVLRRTASHAKITVRWYAVAMTASSGCTQ